MISAIPSIKQGQALKMISEGKGLPVTSRIAVAVEEILEQELKPITMIRRVMRVSSEGRPRGSDRARRHHVRFVPTSSGWIDGHLLSASVTKC